MVKRYRFRWDESVYYLIVALYCIAFLVQEFIHLQDYAQWVYSGVILKGKLMGLSLPAYSCRLYPVPNSLTTIIIAFLSFAVSAPVAAKLLIVGYLTIFSQIVLVINRQLHPGRHVSRSLIILATVIISSSFWNGYLNYQLALLLFAGYYLIQLRGKDSLLINLIFSIVVFFSHAVVFTVFFIYVIYRHFTMNKPHRRLIALFPSAALTAWYLIENFIHGSRTENMVLSSPIDEGLINFFMYKAYTFLKAGPFQNFILANKESFLEGHNSLYYFGIIVSGIFLIVLLWSFVRKLYLIWKKSELPDGDVMFFILISSSYLLFPPKLLQVVNLGERFLMIGLMFLMFRIAASRLALGVLIIIAVLCTSYNLVFLFSGNGYTAGKAPADRIEKAADHRLSQEFRSLYIQTEQKYLNHRIFEGADHYRAIEDADYTKGIFPTGIIIFHDKGP